ncbi:MAG TPA: hypothetical protein VF029_02150 [Actinomycetota bacterium]
MARIADAGCVRSITGGGHTDSAMESRRRGELGQGRPHIWGAIVVVLVAAIGVSFLLSWQALSDAKEAAEGRAEQSANEVLRAALTPEMVSSDITGAVYRTLLAEVSQEILSDDRVVRVRIWKPNGDLVFSTDQRDEVADVVRDDDPRILKATTDRNVSTVTEIEIATMDGLGGTDERLLETFVTLYLPNEVRTSGVGLIDQRYADIEEEVTHVWRPTQIVLAAALGLSVVLFPITAA